MQRANDRLAGAEGKPSFWNSPKRYYDFKSYLNNTFGARVAKLSIDGGFTCPNRDGSRGKGGCIYCDGRGSSLRREGPLPTVTAQLEAMRERYLRGGAEKYIAYFQTFTGTSTRAYAASRRANAAYWLFELSVAPSSATG